MNDQNHLIKEINENVSKVIFGKQKEILNIIKGVIAGGHILIEDIPGVGKTMIIKALTKTLGLSYSRVQCTPDLLPSDIIGVSIYNNKLEKFEFKKGSVFSNVLLADEINRTTPKTQSALLEAMEENQVSESGTTYKLDKPFIVMATQNPIEYEGTFQLPEAQLDRFMIKVKIGYPSSEYEFNILKEYKEFSPIDKIESISTKEDILELQNEVKRVKINDDLIKYIIRIVEATRNNKALALGASVRASLAFQKISQATAFINGRDYVIPEDIKENAKIVLCHRIILTPKSKAERLTEANVVDDILKIIPVPKVKQND